MASSSSSASGGNFNGEATAKSESWRKRRWSGLEIAIVVGSFILFWPLGIVAIILKLTKGELWAGASESIPPWQRWNWSGSQGFSKWTETWQASPWQSPKSSGNAAFDAYRKEQLDRLEQERQKLEEEQRAFVEHLAKLRRAKDQEEFERFMAERDQQKNDPAN